MPKSFLMRSTHNRNSSSIFKSNKNVNRCGEYPKNNWIGNCRIDSQLVTQTNDQSRDLTTGPNSTAQNEADQFDERNQSNVITDFTPPTTPFQVETSNLFHHHLDIHSCMDCGKSYSTASNLTRHRQTHRSVDDKKARKCPHCSKIYVSMPAYSMHIRTHTQGCRCEYCGKCFSRPWLLQGHIRTHTGEKPFECQICSKAFADKSNLRAHVQTHSLTKPFICGRCGKAFALKSYLYKHEESSCMKLSQETIKSSKRNDSRKRSKRFDSIVDDEMKSIQNL
ncbi:uncharacterized protein NH340_JMT04938 [Sarcoptes scabiei]|nr:uncharacterized protein NH340_JMT04938 [Sarcoptes scabiei]